MAPAFVAPVFVTAVCEASVFETPVFEAADLVPAFFLALARCSVVFSVTDGFPALVGLSAAVPEPP
ncbi:hypothetical protein FE633_44650 [Streptomyces montanus]|uniref:Uncharacterized protein n=2 Tax=Streptomyces montanus TaxID=2580423 RepID=A0A5R9FDZ4_9ACTN|nr:hypothetical protein FE633_44650 [Streptomyces montanus]